MLQDGETMRHGLALSFESSDLDEEDENKEIKKPGMYSASQYWGGG